MSREVFELAAPDTSREFVLHCVPPGQTRCSVCGKSRFAQGYHYTRDARLYESLLLTKGQWVLYMNEGRCAEFRPCSDSV